MKPIFLIGYMGSGKSTMGRSLSAFLGIDLIDLDHYIEARYHKSVREIFAERGEDVFRKIESNVLHEVGEFENVIIACGGGTPCFFDNMEYMNQKGITIYMKASHEALMRRLSLPKAKAKRPIIADKSNEELAVFITKAIEKRAPHYNKAIIHFDSSWLEDGAQVATSTQSLAERLKALQESI